MNIDKDESIDALWFWLYNLSSEFK